MQSLLMALRLLACCLLPSLRPAAAFPTLGSKVPMGKKVPCPLGIDGCTAGNTLAGEPASVCHGLGHNTCQGGAMLLNPFGEALKAAGFEWTRELCEADSDGDGHTNGQELGDPCCEWSPDQAEPALAAEFAPSHPGFATSNQSSIYRAPACDSVATPAPSPAVEVSPFQPGEEQRFVDFRIKNFSIPAKRTTYIDVLFNFRETDHDLFHFVVGKALVDQPKNLHHYLVIGCSGHVADELEGVPVTEEDMPEDCRHRLEPVSGRAFGIWSPGADMWELPRNAGLPFGRGANLTVLRINVHFTDGDLHPGATSQDGLRVYYTPTLRSHTVDFTSPIWVGRNTNLLIPPGVSRWFLTRTCTIVDGCADAPDKEMMVQWQKTCGQVAKRCHHKKHGPLVRQLCPKTCGVETCSAFEEDRQLPVVGLNFHGHRIAREMYSTLTRNGVVHDMGSQSAWHYDDQASVPLLSKNLSLRVGDVLQSTCVYDSRLRTEVTRFAKETADEMCMVSLFTLRHLSRAAPNAAFHCQGHAWTGELSPQEDGSQVAATHPWQASWSAFEAPTYGPLRSKHERLLPTQVCPAGSSHRRSNCLAGGKPSQDCCAARPAGSCAEGTMLVGLDSPCGMHGNGSVKYAFMCCTPFATTTTMEKAKRHRHKRQKHGHSHTSDSAASQIAQRGRQQSEVATNPMPGVSSQLAQEYRQPFEVGALRGASQIEQKDQEQLEVAAASLGASGCGTMIAALVACFVFGAEPQERDPRVRLPEQSLLLCA